MIEDDHTDLHNAIVDAIWQRKRAAERVIDEHPIIDAHPRNPRGLTSSLCSGMCHYYAAVVSPETVIRHCEADQRRLDRHTHFYANDSDQAWHRSPCCEHCRGEWPCADIQDLMEVYKIRRI